MLFAACKKTSDADDTIPPTIEIVEPTSNSTFGATTGDCHMEFTASYDVELEGSTVDVEKAAGTNFYTNSLTIGNKTYEYHYYLVLTSITIGQTCEPCLISKLYFWYYLKRVMKK